jgi:hypothetical protein
MNMPHILDKAAETSFLLFKEQVPFKLKNKILAVQCKRKNVQSI